MKKVLFTLLFLGMMLSLTMNIANANKTLVDVKSFPVDNNQGIVSKLKNIGIDEKVSADGKASLKINATEPVVVNLYKSGDIDVEDAMLVYQAKVKTDNFKGQAYLEMWCLFDGKGRFFSRDLNTPIKGNTKGWRAEETPFYLKKGENPSDVELNIVIQGTGTVWVDDVKLLKAPLPANFK